MLKHLIFAFIVLISTAIYSQDSLNIIDGLELQLVEVDKARELLVKKIDYEKWSIYKDELRSYGLPSTDFLEHTAYFFEYSEAHEQSSWVAHMITPEVEQLGAARTNDFRVDSLVITGTAEQEDYFNYYPEKRKEDQYEGFGYDRGHLAPSADFRWYSEAVSESYYYSNMSPQDPELNREKWADLESMLRSYVIRNNVPLAVVTAPILTDDLPKIKQSPNGLSIPKFYLKVVYDPTNKRMIGFLMANKGLVKPVDSYAISVDDLETLTGYDYFPNVDQSLEADYDIAKWFSEYDEGSVKPIKQNSLKRGYFNTVSVASQMNQFKKVNVCGRVVSTRNSRKGNAWINLDRKYPNDYFSVMIYKSELTNFTYDPVRHLVNKNICVEGEVSSFGNKPVMTLKIEESIKVKDLSYR